MGNCCDCFKTSPEVHTRYGSARTDTETIPLLSSQRPTSTTQTSTNSITEQSGDSANRTDSSSLQTHESTSCRHSDSVNTNYDQEGKISTENNTEDVSEWKAYLQKMKNQDDVNTSDSEDQSGEVSSDGSFSLVDLSGGALEESYAEDEIPGYFLYVTGEGVKIWILADGETDGVEINDTDVAQLMARSDVSGRNESDHSDEGQMTESFAPFHLSKAQAVANVTLMRALSACAASYEAALKTQQENEAKRRDAMRAQTMAGLEVGGAETSLSVAERKKRLWDSSGKLASGQKI